MTSIKHMQHPLKQCDGHLWVTMLTQQGQTNSYSTLLACFGWRRPSFLVHSIKGWTKLGAASSTTASQLNPLSVLASCDLWMDFMLLEYNFLISCLVIYLLHSTLNSNWYAASSSKMFAKFLTRWSKVRATVLVFLYPIVIWPYDPSVFR